MMVFLFLTSKLISTADGDEPVFTDSGFPSEEPEESDGTDSPHTGKDGISPGGKAALVIFLLIVPAGCAGAVVGWVIYRKKKGSPVIPEKAGVMMQTIKSKVTSKV